jgi:large subunit ribosomal protein L10
MPTAKKIETVQELTDRIERGTGFLGSEYRGLRVAEITSLRRTLREQGIEMHVVKNTLLRRAADAAGKPAVADLAEGPTALLISYADAISMVKTVVEYQRTARNTFAARSAYIDGTLIPSNRLADIATLPPKEVMIAEFVGALQSPIATFASLISATIQEFSGLLSARTEQLEGASA